MHGWHQPPKDDVVVVMLRQRILNITDRTLRQRRTARPLAEVFAASGVGMEWNDAPVVRSRHVALMTVGFTAPPIARQAYPQLCFNVHLQGWIGNQHQHTAMTQSAREPTLRAKTLAECSCCTPSVLALPSRLVQDMRLHYRTLLGSPYLHISHVPLPQ
jgi:hypothetical protein